LGDIESLVADSATFLTERARPTGATTGHGRATGGELGPVENEDYLGSLLRFASGARATLEASRVAVGEQNNYGFEVHGTKGAVFWDYRRMGELGVSLGTAYQDQSVSTVYVGPAHGYYAAFQPGSANSMSIRVGVIGAGIMGADHVTTLHRQVSGASVSMVADVDLTRAQATANGVPGVRAAGDGFALIADPEVDAVVIASHDSTHAALAIAAVRAGKPVLCEKPLAPTVTECSQVVRAERDAVGPSGSSLISVGFMRRFDSGYVQLKAALDAGEGGAPLLLHNISRGVSSAPAPVTNPASPARRSMSSTWCHGFSNHPSSRSAGTRPGARVRPPACRIRNCCCCAPPTER
jgi:predicted dehydrogenase